jgi:hypothetical protein
MEYTLDAAASGSQRTFVADIAAHDLDALRTQLRIVAASEATDTVTSSQKGFDDVTAQKPAPSGDQCMHGAD